MSKEEMSIDPRIWHACAGGMIQMPLLNSYVYYFPQGHAEHTGAHVVFSPLRGISPCILCKVIDVKFMAHLKLEDVYAKITLCPLESSIDGYNANDERNLVGGRTVSDFADKLSYFAKTLTESDARSGHLTVSKDGAETIFPKLDCSTDNPIQTVIAKDIHGKRWAFWHVYQGIPRRHMLTAGWKAFVNQKTLVAGSSVVFMRSENGDLCVGIRRPKVIKKKNGNLGRGEVRAEDVIKAASLAVKGQAFEITYYPHAGTPEFAVKASSVISATRVQWCVGMRFKMAFEADGVPRKCWFMGTVSSVEDFDAHLWPKSPWRRLKVKWDDDQDLLRKVKRVSPWLVNLVSNMPSTQVQAPLVDLNPTQNLELSIGRCSDTLKKNNDKPVLRLFGQPIHVGQQANHSSDENAKEMNESRIMMAEGGYVLTLSQPSKESYEPTLL